MPDAAIEDVSRTLARRAQLPPVVLHASGALSSQALAALAERGVQTGSAHPMMTFVAGEPPSLEGVWFAVEGSSGGGAGGACDGQRRLGARSFTIEPGSKALYHAFGAMLSPMLATELAAAERIGLRAGIERRDVRRIMEPIVLRTVQQCSAQRSREVVQRTAGARRCAHGRSRIWSRSAARRSRACIAR